LIRVAATGDVHFATGSLGRLRSHLEAEKDLQLLLLAGDLTRRGDPQEAAVLAEELAGLPFPVVAVLGNHDHHRDAMEEVAAALREVGVTVLEGGSASLRVNGTRVGIAGVKGFAGGFAGACAAYFGEREMKDFVATTQRSAASLEAALRELDSEVRIALLHYSPVEGTLVGEPPPLWPFLGSYLLAEAVDRAGADLVLHGHAHYGSPESVTPAGIRVLNVAQTVTGRPFVVLELNETPSLTLPGRGRDA
jgi:Icc-related predicted phosphoesterase